MDRTSSPASTYCSQFSPIRRSQRLIDKENRDLLKIPPKSRSPQLFGETQDECSQLICQQEKPLSKTQHLKPADKVVHLKTLEKVVHLKTSDKVEPIKPANKVAHLKPSKKITHLKTQDEGKKPATKKLKARKLVSPKNTQRKRTLQTKAKPGPKPKQPAKEKRTKLQSTFSDDHLGTTPSPSKLPPQYPAHFVHQLPPVNDTNVVPLRPFSAPAEQLCELRSSPEERDLLLSPLVFGSESSMNLSLSDSIAEIFGTKDISRILAIRQPRQYILIEEHLPAMAIMLNVDLERLQNVLDITQGLSHEQILNFSIKQEREETEDQTN
ncbi:meiotic recombination protein P22 [Drosophila rhopaloa]|uniref:Meiotic recombination protein P22 n=1 Tax=Drosophila rhopaloa TaxID=1041015 RepID=A0ABM5I8D1_DRORH|nr:meiotic recombination protein P22 [Drosophila rhopaloa]